MAVILFRLQHITFTHCSLVKLGWHRSRSRLAQAMAWCLTAPSPYLNQCWLIIREVFWHSPEDSFNKCWINLSWKITNLKLQPHLQGVNELNHHQQCPCHLGLMRVERAKGRIPCKKSSLTENFSFWSLVLTVAVLRFHASCPPFGMMSSNHRTFIWNN